MGHATGRGFALVFLAFVSGAAWADVDPRTEKVAALFAEWVEKGEPGCSVGVIENGDFVHKAGYGMANLDHDLPLTSRSVFRIGSTSKQFTAMSVLLLAEEGKLSLDDDVRRWLPQLQAYESPVTVGQLIHHTSGYRDYLTLWSLAGAHDEGFATDEDVVRMLARQKSLNFEPGSEFLYSNSGYFLLSQIVAAASGKSLREYARERIFEPLGMTESHFHDDWRRIVPQRALGYRPKEGGGFEIDVTTLGMVGDGGVFSSVEELLAWDRNFYQPKAGTRKTIEAMTTPGRLNDDSELDYAGGLFVRERDGRRVVSHGGAFVGYRAELIRFPDQRLSVICLCNRADASPSRLARQIAEIYLPPLDPEPSQAEETASSESAEEAAPPPAVVVDLARAVGTYRRVEDDSLLELSQKEDGPVLTFASGFELQLRAAEDGHYRTENPVPVDLWFTNAPTSGRPHAALRFRNGAVLVLTPAERPSYDAAALGTFAGRYDCAELETVLVVEPASEASSLRLRHADPARRQPDSSARPTKEDEFSLGSRTLSFSRGADGAITALTLAAGRVRDIVCERQPTALGPRL